MATRQRSVARGMMRRRQNYQHIELGSDKARRDRTRIPLIQSEAVLHSSRENSTQEPGVLPWRPTEAKYMALKTLTLYFPKRTPNP